MTILAGWVGFEGRDRDSLVVEGGRWRGRSALVPLRARMLFGGYLFKTN